MQLEVAFVLLVPEDRVVQKRAIKRRGPAVVHRVLEVTLEELGRVGLARLSLPRIAALADINKTSLYRRWPTKQALVAAALALAVPPKRELPDHGDLADDLVDLAVGLATLLASPAGMGVIRIVFSDGETAQTRRLARAMWTKPSRLAPRVVLERAVKRGELRRDVDLDLVLHTIGGAVLHRTFVERKTADREWARGLIRLLTDGVVPRG